MTDAEAQAMTGAAESTFLKANKCFNSVGIPKHASVIQLSLLIFRPRSPPRSDYRGGGGSYDR
jgi:hypothetical protein